MRPFSWDTADNALPDEHVVRRYTNQLSAGTKTEHSESSYHVFTSTRTDGRGGFNGLAIVAKPSSQESDPNRVRFMSLPVPQRSFRNTRVTVRARVISRTCFEPLVPPLSPVTWVLLQYRPSVVWTLRPCNTHSRMSFGTQPETLKSRPSSGPVIQFTLFDQDSDAGSGPLPPPPPPRRSFDKADSAGNFLPQIAVAILADAALRRILYYVRSTC